MRYLIPVFLCLFLVSCGKKEKGTSTTKDQNGNTTTSLDETRTNDVNRNAGKTLLEGVRTYDVGGEAEKTDLERLSGQLDLESFGDAIDLNMDISTLSLADLRLLRNAFGARQGFLFMNADLRGAFSTTSWYERRMEDRFWAEDGGESMAPISYTAEEDSFIARIKEREQELLAQNYVQSGGRKMTNLNNIANPFQLEELNPDLMDMLGRNGFAIVPNDHIQLFHVYERNDYQQFPNFVTTDMYMQLFHMYFGYVLRTIEEEKFIPLIAQVCEHMITDMGDVAQTNPDESIKELARFNATFYAIAYTLLTEERTDVPDGYKRFYDQELASINTAEDNFSAFLEYTNVMFPYSLFKPRGHYTRTDALKRYFKTMMWLQTAPFCLDNDAQLKKAALSASVLANSPNFGTETLEKYRAVLEPMNFIIGLPDNVSFLNLAGIMAKENYDLNGLLTGSKDLEKFRKSVKQLADAQNRIKPKQTLSCVDKINFMPQRYLSDNEVLQELVDVDNPETKRAYPKGLDVMAAFGSDSAEDLLLNELKEGAAWDKYPGILSRLQVQMEEVDWNASLYNKWIESLLNLQRADGAYPPFMQTSQWAKKDLNASLASWAELKHDAILYAEQPMAAECGGDGPPDPYTVGYVEPNIAYWESVIELLDLTKAVLIRNNLMTEHISSVSRSLSENAEFLLSASKKELTGKRLTENEFRQIEYIGSTFEWITLDLVRQPDQYLDGWHNIQGPDKSVAVVADVFTSNANNNPDKGIMHVATGNVNDIYVVVEINGLLYLTKGAVFSYHEFHLPLGNRLTDEEWQKMLENNQAPKVPEWMQEIIVPIKAPASNEKIFYSSGC